MSLEHIEKVVQNFIADKRNDLLVIKGGWGVGKTFFWRRLVDKARAEKKFGASHYSYVSLFGVNSLDDLKNTIIASLPVAQVVKANRGVQPVIDILQQLVRQAEQIPYLRQWTGGTAIHFIFSALRDTLICIDDIERRGSNLDIKDVMGLSSLLKEQRDCKIVLIMNEGGLQGDDAEEFRLHSEKVIDIELSFAPSLDDIFHYVFSNTYRYRDFILAQSRKLNIKNIRTLQRIRRFMDMLLPMLNGSERLSIEDVLSSVVLYTWCFYEKGDGVPTLSFVKDRKSLYFLFLTEKEEADVIKKEWGQTLKEYGYSGTDGLGDVIISLIEKGYLDENLFVSEINKKNTVYHNENERQSHGSVWELYRNTFDDNGESFVRKLMDSFRMRQPYLPIDSLNSAVSVLRQLGHDIDADNIIYGYINQHRNTISSIDRNNFAFTHDLRDKKLIEELDNIWKQGELKHSHEDIIKSIALRNNYSMEDIRILQELTVEDFYKFFKSEKSENLYYYVKACLRFAGFQAANENQGKMTNRAREALLRIAGESPINRMRVSTLYGIEIDADKANE